MKKFILVFLIIFLIPQKVKAEEIYFYEYDERGVLCEFSQHIDFIGDFTQEEKIMIIFDNFFSRWDNELIGIELEQGSLKIYADESIKSYGGGSATEFKLVRGIISNAFNIEQVDNVTLYIDGVIDCLPEGIMLNQYKREEEAA